MRTTIHRREFLAASAAGAALALAGRLEAAPKEITLKKALIGNPTEATLASWKEAGFNGMETGAAGASPEEAAKARAIAEKLGMRIHSVLRGWVNLNSADASAVEKDLASVETALKAAQGYGADAILLVPCRVGGMPMPEAWQFRIKFDEKTALVREVVEGDNSPYAKYIEAQNHATTSSREAVKKLIPAAEKAGVIIALENVWNNLWVKPDLFAAYVKSFDNPWVQAYFDIGNHVKYAPPEEWIRALGHLIVKCHVKDFKLNEDGHGGKFCNIRDGSVNWPVVRKELNAVGRDPLWMTIEGGDVSLQEHSKRLDLIIEGK